MSCATVQKRKRVLRRISPVLKLPHTSNTLSNTFAILTQNNKKNSLPVQITRSTDGGLHILLKMPAHQLSGPARHRPIRAMCRVRRANDEAHSTTSPKHPMCAKTMSVTYHVLGVRAQISVSSRIPFCASLFAGQSGSASADGFHWTITCSAENSMREHF